MYTYCHTLALHAALPIWTVEGQGQVPAYAAYLASVLKEGGFADSEITITPMGETATLVARWPGTGNAKPIVLLGHMDVVAAKAAEWERDPFTAVEENGYVFGRDRKSGTKGKSGSVRDDTGERRIIKKQQE